MAFYIHIGCELTGRRDSNALIDRWIHDMSLFWRLEVMATVMDL